ncbi:MAG TPA: DUF5916 domain-containing protein [Gemmatimonadales bacterium]|nr:DUF5916 domain-containing protein [Gemmatimonadales bacterium]
MPLVASLLVLVVTQSRDSSARYTHGVAPEIRAAPATGSIRLDGRLDEPAWEQAIPVTQFIQRDPNEGQPASERTEVRVLIGDDALYVGAQMHDSDPQAIRSVLARRDEAVESDLFEVLIDAYHDHLSAVRFRITPAGAIRDAVLGAAAQGGSDDVSWDPVWDYAARIDSVGWTAELRLPLSQLRFNPQDDAVWGIQFSRFILRKGEEDFFSFTPKREQAGVNRYGHLTGLGRLRTARHLELLPYALGRAEHTRVPGGDPFRDGSDYFGDGGLDVKYGVTSDLTLDATINPDFGQVEVDPAVVNLSAFETFFPEKRPFFVEGADVFRFGGIRTHNSFSFPRFFFSRRIGRQPQGEIDAHDVAFSDVPTQTTIRAAVKLSGRTRGGWSLGVLDAVTAEERAPWQDTLGGRHSAALEPLTNYFVARTRKDLRAGNTAIGGMVTAAHRDLDEPALASLLRRQAYLVGLDFAHGWDNRNWSLDGAIALSRVSGSAGAIAATQTSSARYYQRPDARTSRYDPARTSLAGLAYQISLARNSGVHWLGSLTYQETGPGFEANDLGFQSNADRRALSTLIGYKEDRPRKLVRNWNVIPFTNHTWNFDGDLVFGSFGLISELTLANFWNLFLRHDYAPRAWDDRLTRGGPVTELPWNETVVVEMASDSRKTTRLSASALYAWDGAGGTFGQYSLSLSLRPAPAARISVGPSLTRNYSLAQYVTTAADTFARGTYGSRYVFGTLDQTELSLVTRVDWTFTPRLSFQLFLQPLISAADFRDLKELAAPRTYDFTVYGRDRGTVIPSTAGDTIDPGDGGPRFFVEQQDFNIRSLRANAVLRWEWRPGSTLFVVWQQAREQETDVGNFRFGRDFDALVHAPADNIFAVKVSYWIGL